MTTTGGRSVALCFCGFPHTAYRRRSPPAFGLSRQGLFALGATTIPLRRTSPYRSGTLSPRPGQRGRVACCAALVACHARLTGMADPDRVHHRGSCRLHPPGRRGLRRRSLDAAGRPRTSRPGGTPGSRTACDGAGLGGQSRLAHLRARGVLDRLPSRLRFDHFDVRGAVVHRRGRDHSPRGLLRAAWPTRPDPRPAHDRKHVRAVLDPDPVRAGHGRRWDRLRPRPRRQRHRRPHHQLAEPHLGAHRRAGRRHRWLPRRRRALARRADLGGRLPRPRVGPVRRHARARRPARRPPRRPTDLQRPDQRRRRRDDRHFRRSRTHDPVARMAQPLRPGPRLGSSRRRGDRHGLGTGAKAPLPPRTHDRSGRRRPLDTARHHHHRRRRCDRAGSLAGPAIPPFPPGPPRPGSHPRRAIRVWIRMPPTNTCRLFVESYRGQ